MRDQRVNKALVVKHRFVGSIRALRSEARETALFGFVQRLEAVLSAGIESQAQSNVSSREVRRIYSRFDDQSIV